MILTLIGMSGSGKTHWSQKLAEAGYVRIGCDDRIERRLANEGHLNGPGGIESVARWMGQPYEPGFAAREAAYLQAEGAVAGEILAVLEQGRGSNVVIDTTGSVVYLGEETCRRLQAHTTIVYLETSPAELEEMFRQYLVDPKPVVWGDAFRRHEGESGQQALARCYRDLLHARWALYARYAAVKLSTARLREARPDASDFLHMVRQELKDQQECKARQPSGSQH